MTTGPLTAEDIREVAERLGVDEADVLRRMAAVQAGAQLEADAILSEMRRREEAEDWMARSGTVRGRAAM